MISALALVAASPSYASLLIAWAFIGAAQSLLGIRGSELLAANSGIHERAHIYAAHFALSHAGWGITYPLAGFLTSRFGFSNADWIFACLVALVSVPYWILQGSNLTKSPSPKP